MKYLWKSMKDGLHSNYDNSQWKVGEWRIEKPPTVECKGLNASLHVMDAIQYVNMEVLAKVEVAGKIIKGSDKWTCEKMKVVEAYIWPKEESVRMAIYAAELVIDIYERRRPGDDRPRKAIEAAKKWLGSPSAAARAAASAARAAASAARAAAWAASGAASEAASAAALDKIEAYLLSRIEYLEKYEVAG